MPQHKSAEKRVRQSKRRNAYNKQNKSEMKSLIKTVKKTVKKIVASKGSPEEASKALSATFKKLDKMATKGIIHKNNAANKKSKLTKLVKTLSEQPTQA